MLRSGHPPETRTRVLTYGHTPGSLKHDIDLGLKVCKPRPVKQEMETWSEQWRTRTAYQAEGTDRATRAIYILQI